MSVKLKNKKDIAELRISGKILASVLKMLGNETNVGVTLKELDNKARNFIYDAGAEPAFLGYRPERSGHAFPASICASVNDVVVHGIPTKYILKDGDILSLDAGVKYHGYFTDAAITVGVGKISKEAEKLIKTTKMALEIGIKECIPGKHLGDIGYAIQYIVEKAGFHIARGLTGHGVGFEIHEDPVVNNYGKRGKGMELRPGLVIAIEPMISTKTSHIIQDDDDSFKTYDGSLAAHFEHTVLIMEDGYEVLTK